MNALFSEGLTDVIIYSSPDDPKKKNRGFAFLEYDTHKSASIAKRRIGNGRTKVWGCDIIVDWADPQEEPDIDTMSKVRTQSKYSLPSLPCRVRRPENHTVICDACYIQCFAVFVAVSTGYRQASKCSGVALIGFAFRHRSLEGSFYLIFCDLS